jgi:hypothetical protein
VTGKDAGAVACRCVGCRAGLRNVSRVDAGDAARDVSRWRRSVRPKATIRSIASRGERPRASAAS